MKIKAVHKEFFFFKSDVPSHFFFLCVTVFINLHFSFHSILKCLLTFCSGLSQGLFCHVYWSASLVFPPSLLLVHSCLLHRLLGAAGVEVRKVVQPYDDLRLPRRAGLGCFYWSPAVLVPGEAPLTLLLVCSVVSFLWCFWRIQSGDGNSFSTKALGLFKS